MKRTTTTENIIEKKNRKRKGIGEGDYEARKYYREVEQKEVKNIEGRGRRK